MAPVKKWAPNCIFLIKFKASKDYLVSDPAGRKGTPIITVRQGKEPVTFTGFFAGWDDEFWDTDVNDKLEFNYL